MAEDTVSRITLELPVSSEHHTLVPESNRWKRRRHRSEGQTLLEQDLRESGQEPGDTEPQHSLDEIG